MNTCVFTKNTPKFIFCSKKGIPRTGTSRTNINGSYPSPRWEAQNDLTVVCSLDLIRLSVSDFTLQSLTANEELGSKLILYLKVFCLSIAGLATSLSRGKNGRRNKSERDL